MKIVVFNDTYKELSGAETYFFHLADLLSKRGHLVSLAGFGDQHQRSDYSYMYRETTISIMRYFWRVTFNLRVYFSLRKWLKERQPDIIHLCNINKYTLAVLAACRGYKTIHSVLDYGLVCPGKFAVRLDTMEDCPHGPETKCMDHRCLPWYYLVLMCIFSKIRKRFLHDVVSYYITESPLLKEYLETASYIPLQQINLGIEIKKWHYKEKTIPIHSLLYVGFLEQNKGVRNLPDILKQVHKKYPATHLVVIGDGSLKQKLIEGFQSNNVYDKVIMIDRVTLEQLEPYYQQADMLLMPSLLIDNAPLVIMQAMACGTPVIGSRRGGIPWQIGDAGRVASTNNPSSFAEAIINYYYDISQWKQSSQLSHTRAAMMFNSESNINRIMDLYKQLQI